MKRAPAKSADNDWAVMARMAESSANDIDCFPPRKSSAERRMRATSRKLGRLPAEPDCFTGVCFAHWNGLTVQADNQHWPLIRVQATQLGHFIVREMSGREAVAADSAGGECKRLPSVPYVVQAVPICPFIVLPRL